MGALWGPQRSGGLSSCPNPTLCALRHCWCGIKLYVSIAREMRFGLSTGYLLRPNNSQGHILNLPRVLGSSCIFDRPALTQARRYTALGLVALLRLRLQYRGGLADFMAHVGWYSPATARYYLQLASMLKAGAPADLLSRKLPSLDGQTADIYGDFNHLKDRSYPGVSIFFRPTEAARLLRLKRVFH